MGDPVDRQLAERAAAGEEGAWREIYDRTRDRLFALLCYQMRDREEAMDVLQETYLHAIRNIGTFRAEGSLEGWLAVIALRRSVDWKRKVLARLKRTAPLEEAQTVAAENPSTVRFAGERQRIRRCLEQLTDRQRAAFLLRELGGSSFADVARAIGCKEATARVHHMRARQRLQSLLKSGTSPLRPLRFKE